MVRVTAEAIQGVCTKNGRFFVPDRVKASIESCLASDDEGAITAEYRRLLAEYLTYVKVDGPALMNYGGSITLDAYTAYYLPRYLSIAGVALRDLAFGPFFREVPDSLRVLDLGSGTGAVVLGLLSLFSTSSLSRMSVDITAVDCCAEALDRQKRLIKEAGFNPQLVHHCEQDLCDVDSCMKQLSMEDPYHLVFLANCLTELERDVAIDLIGCLPEVLADNGAIIIAESQRNYVKKLIRSLAATVGDVGLRVYYPCPAPGCPYAPYCWVWRDHSYRYPRMKAGGRPFLGAPKEEFPLSWLILTRQRASIYDPLAARRPDLVWGPISKLDGSRRSVCNGNQYLPFRMDSAVSPKFKRGSIVGLSGDGAVSEYLEL